MVEPLRAPRVPSLGARFRRSRWAAFAFAFALGTSAVSAAPVAPHERVDRIEETPKQLRGVDVTEHLEKQLPLDLKFRDQNGRDVRLGQFFDGRKPVLLTLNYARCPLLCSLQLPALVNSLRALDWGINQEFQVVTVSLEPDEPQELTQQSAARYLAQYGRPASAPGWHFLSGSAENVKAYADALGISYKYDERRNEYAHPAVVVLGTPSGIVARYLYGLDFAPKTLRLGLVEASEGRIGTTIDKLILYCFHYDATEGRYAPVARRIMQVGAAVSVVLIAGFLWALYRADKKKRRHLAQSTAT